MMNSDAVEKELTIPWHSMTEEAVFARCDSQTTGLSDVEAQARLQRIGANSLTPVTKRTVWQRFLAQFNNVLIHVLLVAGVVAAWLGHWADSSVIFGVVVLNAIIGFIQEGKAEKSLEAIRGMLSQQAAVKRDGKMITLAAEQLVPGDVVFLQSGDKVPADMRLFQVKQLRVDEAILTGESVPVNKQTEAVAAKALLAERLSMAYSGTMISYGQAWGVVVATGDVTEVGHIGALLERVETLTTPLLRKINYFAKWLTAVTLLLAFATFLFGLLVHDYDASDMFMAAVGLVVAAIPEGLPAIMTIALAIGVQRMAKRNAIIRRLPAVEALGSVTAICTDKTGTLTRNEMTVTTVSLVSNTIQITGVGYDPHGELRRDDQSITLEASPELHELIRAVALCNEARVVQQEDGWHVVGDPTEGALCTLALKAGLDIVLSQDQMPRTDVIPFESEHKFMATLHHDHAGHAFVYAKGAPERLLEMCALQRSTGEDQSINLPYWHAQMDDMAARGLRILAVAFKQIPSEQRTLQFNDIHAGMTLLGLVGIIDPPREEAIEAVNQCANAGIRVIMITGDHALTARAVATQLGIVHHEQVITGAQLDAFNDEQFADCARNTNIFARTTPEHKLRLVQALQAQDHVVAMTGDGVNDAPALKRADVGIAMGDKGTEVAKEAAEMVLADDNFASIHHAVVEGRTVYDNLTKSIIYVLPTSVAEALTIVAAILLGLSLPITPVQILWVNMITAVTLSLTLAFEKTESNVMLRPPRDPAEPILSPYLVWRIIFVSLILVSGTFGLYFFTHITEGASVEYARTVAVNTLVMFEVFYLFNARHIMSSSLSWRTFVENRCALMAVAILVVFQLLFTYLPQAQALFGTQALTLESWLMIVLVASSVFVLVELEKALVRRRG